MRIPIALALAAFTTTPLAAQPMATAPETRRVEHVDEYHGTTVLDAYRWLENDAREDAEVADWVRRQNEVTFGYLESIPARERIRERLTELWDYEKIDPPFRAGGRLYFMRNDGLQNHHVLYVVGAGGEPEVVLDPNTWSDDGTVALAGMAFSDDGRHLAYGIADAGSDWQRYRVLDLHTGETLDDELRWIKFSSPSWTTDGRGFFYARYDAPDASGEFQAANKFQKLFYHRLGTPQADDVLVYKRDDQPDWGFGARATDDGRYLVITIWQGTDDRHRVLYRDLTEPYAMPVDLIDEFTAEFDFIGNDGPVFYFKTDGDAPLGRIVAIDVRRPARENWREIVPESKDTMRTVSFVGNLFVVSYLQDARSAVRTFTPAGEHVRDVALPGIGSAVGFAGRRTDTDVHYAFSSFDTPPTIYRYDLLTGESTLYRSSDVDFDPEEYTVRQVFYTSLDGTRVPMFICHRRDLELDGNRPALLYGYGGFDIPLTPAFSVSRIAWMEMGGVFAQAGLRGGGEYGEAWHDAGTKLNKQRVFDDFIAAAEWLCSNGYTRPERLAIQGGSNGGLLVGACMTQRPDLFGACLPAVGVMDMLRFHKFTIGWAWVDDYGSSDDPAEFEALLAYSPYHNLAPGVEYPATLITTADTDDRVVPGHSFKFAAALQYAQSGDAPVLIRIETDAGHGAGKPTSKRIEEIADQWAFLVRNLGVE